jgi:DNA replication protein DnaC
MQMTEDPLKKLRELLKAMKLYRMEEALDEQLSLAEKQNWSTAEVMQRLFAIEYAALVERRIKRRIKESKLDELKILDDFDFDFQKSIDKKQIMELATLAFVQRRQWLILAGNSGTGKSHIAKALVLLCCKNQYRCRYTTASDMLQRLMAGLADDTLEQKLKQYIRPQVLLIDEIGFDRLEQEETRKASLFFKVIEGRYCKNSTILTTNIDFEALGEYLGDPVITASLVDRMVHHAVIINIEGPSYRMHESKALNTTSGKKKK